MRKGLWMVKKGKNQADVVTLVEKITYDAIDAGASDIHFEPTAENMIIKFRLDGELKAVDIVPKSLSDNVIARLKVLAHLLTYRNDIPQEGRIAAYDKAHESKVIDKRLAIFPTIHGQRAVVRLFYEDAELTDLEKLGLCDFICSAIRDIAGQNQGVLLLTGPAGSGKSTTLAAILRYIGREFPGRSIVALEDPVERHIQGVTQIEISPQLNGPGAMSYPVALRSLLRQDPQVLMIGEIRDAETARIVIEAGLTGHLLMSTLHSGTPAGALLRLLEMGIEPYQVTSSISAILSQRLVRKLCTKCRQRNLHDGRFEAVGCESCFQTGFRGRSLVAEMVQLDGGLRKAILAKADMDELMQILKARGHMSLLQDSARLISQGITTEDEVSKICGRAVTE
ncbi:MAG: GspE/PulE family protein [Planctomycetota bacterium]